MDDKHKDPPRTKWCEDRPTPCVCNNGNCPNRVEEVKPKKKGKREK